MNIRHATYFHIYILTKKSYLGLPSYLFEFLAIHPVVPYEV